MNTHAKYADWDGAYVMGALSRTERLEFEEHLAGCARCSEAVGDLGALPGLLAVLHRDDAELLLRPPVADPPPDLARRSLDALPNPWWRRGVVRSKAILGAAASVRLRAGLTLAAAAAVLVAIVVPLALHHDTAPPAGTVAVALQQTQPSPITAQVSLTTARWGTRVDMVCEYAATGGGYRERPYSLYVVDRAGHPRLVSNWHAGPGQTTRTTGSTALAVSDIASVELRAGDGTVLLRGVV